MENKSNHEWMMQEIKEIDKIDIDSTSKLALRINVIYECARREGLNYELLKNAIITKSRPYENDTLIRSLVQISSGNDVHRF